MTAVDPLDEPIVLDHEFVVTPEYRGALARGLLARSMLHPLVLLVELGIVLVFAGVAGVNGSNPAPAIAAAFVLVVVVPIRWAGLRSALRRALPDGTVLRSGFGASSFRIDDGSSQLAVDYGGVADVTVKGAVAWVRYRQPRRVVGYPAALFPPEVIARMTAVG